jgi:hypothetical protein
MYLNYYLGLTQKKRLKPLWVLQLTLTFEPMGLSLFLCFFKLCNDKTSNLDIDITTFLYCVPILLYHLNWQPYSTCGYINF